MGNGKQLNNEGGGTLFDSVFRTECEYMKPLLIPVINELFSTDYSMESVEVVRLANEHVRSRRGKKGGYSKKITDSLLKIGNLLYHVECQSTEEGDILVRLVDYNMRIGFEHAEHDKRKSRIRVNLPKSALLMLRRGAEGEDKLSRMEIEYAYEDKVLNIDIPVMHVQAYSMEEIFDKKLYFLIPFYTMRYEKLIGKIAEDKEKSLESSIEYDNIISEMKKFTERLVKAYEEGEISEDYSRELAKMYRDVTERVAAKLDKDRREGMVDTMQGQLLKLQSDIWIEEGIEIGRKEGIKEGKQAERANTERERKKAQQEKNRAEQERKRADALEKEVRELRAKLAAK